MGLRVWDSSQPLYSHLPAPVLLAWAGWPAKRWAVGWEVLALALSGEHAVLCLDAVKTVRIVRSLYRRILDLRMCVGGFRLCHCPFPRG